MLSEFDRAAEVENVAFHGAFGVLARSADGKEWLTAVGARTLRGERLGFDGRADRWRCPARADGSSDIVPRTLRPRAWQVPTAKCRSWIAVHDGSTRTGFPVKAVANDRIAVNAFPLPDVEQMDLPVVAFHES